jgi:hypothetical protein
VLNVPDSRELLAISDIKMLWHRSCPDYGREAEMNQKTASREIGIAREEEKRLYEIV